MMTFAFLQVSPYLMALPVAILIGVIAAAVAIVMVIRNYSMKHKPVEYPLDRFTKLDLREKQDVFLGSHVTSRTINTNRK